MTFLNILLIGGIAAAAIPIIIHILNKSRIKQVKWGAMHLLKTVSRENKRRIRIEQLILLILRISIPIVLALCMARPVITGMSGLLHNSRTSTVVLIDNSSSMEAGSEARSHLDEAKDFAGQIMKNLPKGSEVSVVGMASEIPLLEEPSFNIGWVRKQLDLQGRSAGSADVPATIEKASGIFASRMHNADREFIIISDFQKVSWGASEAPDRKRMIELLSKQPIPPRVLMFQTDGKIGDNIAVESIHLSHTVVGVEQPVNIRATIKNHGKSPFRDLRIYFRVDGEEYSASQITLKPHTEKQVLFTHTFTTPGSHIIEIFADAADSLRFDNTKLLSLQVPESIPVLLISGDMRSEPMRSETDFLEIALSPYSTVKRKERDLITTKTISETEITLDDLDGVRVVVLANVKQLTEKQLAALEVFIREGGSLLLFPGDRVNTSWYNTTLFADNNGIMPCKLGMLSGSNSDSDKPPASILARHYDHAALTPFNAQNSGNLMSAQIRWWYKLILPSDISDEIRNKIDVMVRLDNGFPFLVEKAFGEGRVIMCCTAADADWSNLPMRPFYLPLQQQMIVYLASKMFPPHNIKTGDHLVAFTSLEDIGKTAILTDGYEHSTDLEITDANIHGMIKFEDTIRPGLYLLTMPSGEIIHFVVNIDEKESNTDLLSGDKIKKIAEEFDAKIIKSAQEYKDLNKKRRFGREVWKALLLLVLIIMFTELILLQYFTRRKT